MQIAHAEDSAKINSVRGAEREFKTLLIGDENALDNFRRYRNVSTLNVAQHRHYETSNPGRPPVKNVGMAYDLDVRLGPRRRPGEGVPNIDVLDFSLGFSLSDHLQYSSTC